MSIDFLTDERSILRFDGVGSEQLQSVCERLGTRNVILTERFDRSETLHYVSLGDIGNNVFGNHTPLLDYAVSNRLYNAVQLGMPLLVSPDTYMEQIINKYGLGFSIDINDDSSKDRLYEYYRGMVWEDFYKRCDVFLRQVENDESEWSKYINDLSESTLQSNRLLNDSKRTKKHRH